MQLNVPKLRPYQSKLDAEIHQAWAQLLPSNPNAVVLAVSPTGTGKTVTFSEVIRREPGASCAIAHRKEIVSQIALALARNGVRHRVIGSKQARKHCQRLQLKKLKRHFVDPNAKCAVAGIDTLNNIGPTDPEAAWLPTVRLWVGDEGHHFLRDNKWGKGVAKFPNARGLLVTATPCRADGKGLGRHAHGFADVMVLGPTMRDAINMGYLVGYRVAMPETDINIAKVRVSENTGEFIQRELAEAFHESKTICGDIVRAYRKYLDGKRAVVFCVDVEEATKTARTFREAGIPAEAVNGETDDEIRDNAVARLESGELRVLVNVDLFGEGFDLPSIDGVIMARHTESFSLYAQQWGRGARLELPEEWAARWDEYTDEQRRYMISISSKPYMWLIDMVGNVERHGGPPDFRVSWSLDARSSRSSGSSDAIPTRVCLNKDVGGTGVACAKVYERVFRACPYCGHYPEPPERTAPALVDGDVLELEPAALEAWRAKIAAIDKPVEEVAHGHDVVAMSIRRRHWDRQQAQEKLRLAMEWWSGFEAARGRPDLSEQYRRFYFLFGSDVATAQTLGAREASDLWLKIHNHLAPLGIDVAAIPLT
jgi:superfamily II DNA or RNA helicase